MSHLDTFKVFNICNFKTHHYINLIMISLADKQFPYSILINLPQLSIRNLVTPQACLPLPQQLQQHCHLSSLDRPLCHQPFYSCCLPLKSWVVELLLEHPRVFLPLVFWSATICKPVELLSESSLTTSMLLESLNSDDVTLFSLLIDKGEGVSKMLHFLTSGSSLFQSCFLFVPLPFFCFSSKLYLSDCLAMTVYT